MIQATARRIIQQAGIEAAMETAESVLINNRPELIYLGSDIRRLVDKNIAHAILNFI